LSNDIRTLRSDTEHKFQEVTRTIGGLSDALNERIDAHVVATSKAQNSIEKVNTEITCLREQLAARRLTESAIPNQALPVTAVNVESSSQSISGLATSAGSDHMGKGNVNDCTMSVCGNTKSQPNVNSNLGPAIVNVTSDVFANNSLINELTLPKFHDSSKQILLHFLRDLDEYYRIKNIPESLKLPLAMRAITDPIAKNWLSTVYGELNDY